MAQSLLLGIPINAYVFGILLYLGLNNVLWSTIIATILLLIAYYLLQNNKVSAMHIFFGSSLTIITEMFIHTHFLGWDSGFYYYIFILPAVFLMSNKWSKIITISFYSSVLILILVLFTLYFNKKSAFPVSPEIISYINLCNFSISGISILIIISHFNRTVLKKENELLNLNIVLTKRQSCCTVQ